MRISRALTVKASLSLGTALLAATCFALFSGSNDASAAETNPLLSPTDSYYAWFELVGKEGDEYGQFLDVPAEGEDEPLQGCDPFGPNPGCDSWDNSDPAQNFRRFDSPPIPSANGGEFKMSVHFIIYQGTGTPICDAGECEWTFRWQAFIWWRPNVNAPWQFTPNPSPQFDEWHWMDDAGNKWPQTAVDVYPPQADDPSIPPQGGNSQPGVRIAKVTASCPGLGQSSTTSYTITISGGPGGPSLSTTLDFVCACLD